jgi:RHH-type proline utilization regulon transcriptional repressor/proline dehydrogenase/delta 1-pyrroline-5-carboxylate dehydrogenase
VAEGAERAVAPLARAGFQIVGLDGQVDVEALVDLVPLDAVAACGPTDWLRALRCALARRRGPIIGLETAPVAPLRFVLERHLCIDTTAAGGNASLLAASA